jgi:hypothetical protein
MVKAIEAIAERMLDGIEDHATALRIKAEANRLKAGAEALDRVNSNRSPLDTPAAHALKVAKLARTFDKEITASLQRACRTWADGFNDAQRRIEEKINLTPDAFAGEIRTAFRSLSSKAKADLLLDLTEQNRGPELAAILKAPSVLTGLSDQERANYEKSVFARHAAAELGEQQKLQGVLDAFNVAQRAAGTFVKELTDPGKLAAIERDAAASAAAGAAFDQSLQP